MCFNLTQALQYSVHKHITEMFFKYECIMCCGNVSTIHKGVSRMALWELHNK